jgi:hypothetical protein
MRFVRMAAVAGAFVLTLTGTAMAQNPVVITGDGGRPDGSITLTAQEAQTGDAVLIPSAGTTLEATITPDGCESEDCEYVVSASGGEPFTATAAAAKKGKPFTRALNGAKISKVKVTRKAPIARASLWISSWGDIIDDHSCNSAPPQCGAWELQLNSKAYTDASYAWGSRSRHGYAGWMTIYGTKGNLFTIDSYRTEFVNDPHPTSMYATHDARVSDYAGYTTRIHYVHRHYQAAGWTWLVVD